MGDLVASDDSRPELLTAGVGGFGVGQPADALEPRILEATSRCVARWGVAKTTIDDIAREAGCSRATIYRVLPGGKQALLLAAGHHEIGRAMADLAARAATAETLPDLLTELVCGAADFVLGNEALQYLVAHEPEVILPHVSFDGLEPLLHRVAELTAPVLGRFLEPEPAWRTAEWLGRLVVAYLFDPSGSRDLRDPSVTRRFLDRFVLPGLAADGVPDSLIHPPVPATT